MECGLRSRFNRPCFNRPFRLDLGTKSDQAGRSEVAASRRRVDRLDLPDGSVRFRVGLSGSTSAFGDGIGVPTCRCDTRLKLRFRCGLGGVARAAMISDTMAELGSGTSVEAVDDTFGGCCGYGGRCV